MSLPKYIVNFDELTDDLKNKLLEVIDDELKYKYPLLNTYNLQSLLDDIKELLPSVCYNKLKNKIDSIILTKIIGVQKVNSKIIDVPAIIGIYKEKFIFKKDVYLTGLHFNQTGWKKQDTYSLKINKNKIINNARSKEIGEHKYFNTFKKVNANTPIFFILNNNSGNSRQTLVDLEFIEGEEITDVVDPQPEGPTIDDIENEWDIAVVMNWEKCNIDVDLHGFIEDKHVYFGNREYPNFFLNFDYREHNTNQNPEIMSVKGYKNKKLEVFIHNYTGGNLKESVSIKIYAKKIYGNKLLKVYSIKLNNNRNLLYGVCTIDLKNYKVTNLNKKISVTAGGI